jgi:hypothetical protein
MPQTPTTFTDLDLQILLSGNVPTSKVLASEIVPLNNVSTVLTPPANVIGMFISIHPRFSSGSGGVITIVSFPDSQGNTAQVFLGGSDKFFLLGSFDIISQVDITGDNYAGNETASVLYF